MAILGEHGVSRRTLLIGGGVGAGLVLGWAAWPRRYRPNLGAGPGETIFNAFLKIGEDGHIVVVVPQAEMGQGVYTALPQILADELGADWRTIAVEPAPLSPLYANVFLAEGTARELLPDFLRDAGGWAAREVATRSTLMVTGGSTSIRGFEGQYREAGAAARALLCMAAAKRWDADWRACDTAEGFVVRGDDRLRFGALLTEAARLEPPEEIPLRSPGVANISGQPMPRLDLPSKVDGSARFAGDVRLPGMVFASVRHGPVGDTRLVRVDPKAADRMPGVIAIVRHDRWVAGVANNWWAADNAVNRLAPRFETRGGLADSASIDKALRDGLDSGKAKRFGDIGDVDAVLAEDALVTADYAVPLAAHAAIEPLTATAQIEGDRIALWVPTQAPAACRAAVAKALGCAEAAVTIYPTLIGGGFGRKVEHDAAVQAAIVARAVDRPVQLLWSRAEETMQDRFRPPARARLTARLGRGGTITGWKARIATPSAAGETMERIMPGWGSAAGTPEAGAVEGATPPYAIGALAVEHVATAIRVPTGMWRSVANSYTNFFTESFVDELARKANADPLSYRLQLLGGNRRLFHCLSTAASLGGWDGGVAGSNQGLAAFSGYGAHIALLAEAHVGDNQAIVVDRLVAAVDCGRVINPDIVLQQIEGGLIWGLGAALGGAIGFTRGMADARNFDALGLPTLAAIPDIRVELVRSGEAPGGVGELAVPPVAPAIANAIFAATGQRLRTLPLTPGGA